MATIPYQSVPQIGASGEPGPALQTVPVGGFDELQRGAAQFGAGVGAALEKAKKDFEEEDRQKAREAELARRKALAGEVTDGETEFTKRKTQRLYGSSGTGNAAGDAAEEAFTGVKQVQPGFLSTQGRAAAGASVEAMTSIEKDRRDIADSIGDAEARDFFLRRTGGSLEEARHQIESHVLQQRKVADIASLEARKGAALEAIQANPNNLTEVERQAAELEGPIRALSLSPDDASADAKKWRQQAAAAQVLAQLRANDWQSAETTLKNKEPLLSTDVGDKLRAQVEKVKVGVTAEVTAANIVHQALRPDGSVNDRAALDALDKVPPDVADNVRPVLYRRMTEAEQAFKAETSRVSQKAFTAYNRGGWAAIPAGLKDQLNQRNPELYDRLKNEEKRRFQQSRSSAAEARREQSAVNKEALNDFMALPVDQQATANIDEFLQQHPGVDSLGRSSLGPAQQRAQASVSKGLAVPQDTFVKDATADNQGFLPSATTKKQREARAASEKAFAAEATQTFTDFVQKNGRPPTSSEAAQLRAVLVSGRAPQNANGVDAAAQAIVNRVNGAPAPAPHKVEIIGPNGARALADESGLDAWLAAHPKWKRP